MIGQPLNDCECLGAITELIYRFVDRGVSFEVAGRPPLDESAA